MKRSLDRIARSVAYRVEYAARRYFESREARRWLQDLPVDSQCSLSVEEARAMAVLSRYGNRFQRLVDIGAHRGQFTAALACVFDLKEIICVEPDATLFNELESAVPAHSRIVNCAISDVDGASRFFLHPDRSMNSLQPAGGEFAAMNPHYGEDAVEAIAVETMTLDTLRQILEPSESRDIVLKLDVQGAERRVLAAGKEFMNEVSVVVMEQMFWFGYEGSWQLREMVERMGDYGFEASEVLKVAYRGNRTAYVDYLFSRR